MKFNKLFLTFFAFFIFFFSAIYITYPLIFHLGNYTTGFGDELLIAWIHNWVFHSLTSGNILNIFHANIYYPYNNTLAYSDIFITSTIISFIPFLLIKEPIVFNNFTLISSLTLLGFSIYLLCFYITKNYYVSILSGLIIIFSPSVLSNYIHLQMLSIWFVPLAILYFLKFLKLQNSYYLLISLFFFILQVYNSFLPGYFILFTFFIIFIFYLLKEKTKYIKLFNKKNISYLIVIIMLTLPVVIPYYQVSREFNYTREITEAIHLALQPEDLLFASSFSRLNPFLNSLPLNKIYPNTGFKPGFPGLVFIVVIIISLIYFFKNLKQKNILLNSFVVIGFTGLILSLGPALHLGRHTIHYPFPIPLPYALFYYIIPGFQGFRNSQRWEMLFIIAMTIIISLLLPKLINKYSNKIKLIIYLLLITGIIAEFNYPMQFAKIPQKKDFPKVYEWLNSSPNDSVVIELPIYTCDMHPYVFDENMREYYSTVHFRILVNGASGFSPPPWMDLVRDIMREFPNNSSIDKIGKLGVNYIIVHKNEFDRLNTDKIKFNDNFVLAGNEIISKLSNSKKIKFINKIENDYVYKYQ